jgi:predicted Fe-Mo cluster-binding NifX family protein
MMKIALPARDGAIDDHFGHCDYFQVVTVDEGKIVAEQRVDPPAGCGCKSNIVSTLAELGVTVMLAGNMGQGAVNVLGGHGIKTYRGLSGPVAAAVELWLAGNVTDSGQSCTAHEGCHE